MERYVGSARLTDRRVTRVFVRQCQSERLIGEWMKARENRDEMVIATKYTIAYKNVDPKVKLKVSYMAFFGQCEQSSSHRPFLTG